MKYAFALLATIATGLVFVISTLPVSAWERHYHRHPVSQPPVVTPPPVTTAPIQPPVTSNPPVSSSGHLCWNVGQEANASVQTETPLMQSLKGKTDCVRIADFGTNSSLAESLALLYKNNGFYVEIGNDAGTLSPSTLAQYDAGVIAEGRWGQNNSVDEVSVGNEQEYRLSGMSIADWIAHVKSLAAQVKQVYSGKVSYSTSGDFVPQWIAAGSLGALDSIGENDYCGFTCNESYIKEAVNAWGASHVEVSEINCDIPNVAACSTDSGLRTELQGDLAKLHAEFPTIPFYIFALKTGGDEPRTIFSMTNYPNSLAYLESL
jgi:hypothetical protein